MEKNHYHLSEGENFEEILGDLDKNYREKLEEVVSSPFSAQLLEKMREDDFSVFLEDWERLKDFLGEEKIRTFLEENPEEKEEMIAFLENYPQKQVEKIKESLSSIENFLRMGYFDKGTLQARLTSLSYEVKIQFKNFLWDQEIKESKNLLEKKFREIEREKKEKLNEVFRQSEERRQKLFSKKN